MKKIYFLTFFSVLLSIGVSSQSLIISEFRLRGPSGANDEFIEINNNTNSDHTVAGGGTGYAIVASDGTARGVIPNGTVIPARGHYLFVNSVGYSLASYPAGNGTTATGDATYTTDIPDNAGIALFNTSVPGDFTLANRLDAVGSTSEANTLYKEGTGYPALTPFSIDYCWRRKTYAGGPADSDNNAADFEFDDTNGTSAGGGQRLGAPGPENLSSPITSNPSLLVSLLDPCVDAFSPPNRVRDFTSDPANNSTFGTWDLRYTITNNTGVSITRLRFRIDSISTFPAPFGFADLRPRTSTAVVVTVDRTPCGSGTSNVTVQGTSLEQPPSQPNGGGYNSSMSAGIITLATPLANGASVDIRMLFGVQQDGVFAIKFSPEVLPNAAAAGAIAPPVFVSSIPPCTMPTITCPANITIPAAAGQCSQTVTYSPTVGGSPVPTLTYSFSGATTGSGSGSGSGSVFNVGTTTVTITATNTCGTATCTFTVTVNDTENPTASPVSSSFQCGAQVPPPNAAVITDEADNCGVPTVTFLPNATTNNGGTGCAANPLIITRYYRVQDAAGNFIDVPHTITIVDNTPPVVTCPANITVGNTPGICGAVVNFTPTATDNCTGAVTITSVPASGSTFPVGTTTVTVTATDACGNTATCSFTVTVNDTEPPVLTCPANITTNATAGLCSASVTTPNPTNTDNCAVTVRTWTLSGATTGASPAAGLNNVGTQTFNVGVTTVTYTSRDAAGNTATCTFTVTVNDVQPPVITCPANITVSNDLNLCSAVVTYPRPTATDNCTQPVSNFSVTWSQTGQRGVFFDVTNVGTAPVVVSGFSPAMWGAAPLTDNFSVYFTTSATTYSGNQTNAGAWTLNTTSSVSFPGGANPVQVSVPLATPVTLAPGQSRGVYIVGTQSFGGGPVAYLSTGGAPPYTGPQSYQNGAIRFSGGVGSSGLFTGIFGTGLPGNIRLYYGSVNISPVITQLSGIPSGGTFPVGLTTNVFQATDPSGNTATCSFTVRVNDTQAPTITCPANITVTSPAGSCTAVVNYTATANDNCPGATVQVVSGPASGSAFPVGVTTVTLRAVDAAGNVSTNCSFTVTVLDGQLPVITAQPQNRTVCAGQSATFTVTAVTSPNANGPLSYQWQLWNGSAWVNVAGATASSLTVSNVTLNQNTNSYRVQITGLCTTIFSNHATLYVNPNPVVTITPSIAPDLLPGQNLTLTAVADIAGGTYQWFRNGVAIAGATASTLGPLTVTDAGTYRVVYTGPAPTNCVGTSADLVVSAKQSEYVWIYPNPNNGIFNVRFYNRPGEEATVKVFNALGQEVYNRKVRTAAAYSTILVDLSSGRVLTSGVYTVVLYNESGEKVEARNLIIYY